MVSFKYGCPRLFDVPFISGPRDSCPALPIDMPSAWTALGQQSAIQLLRALELRLAQEPFLYNQPPARAH